MKTCCDCKQRLTYEFFSKRSKNPDGYELRCKTCRKTFREKYKDKARETYSRWYQDNRERKANYQAIRNPLIPEKRKMYRQTYRAKYLTTVRLRESLKNTARRTRIPKWLSKKQWQDIQYFYSLRDEAQMLTGDKYHVDHIVPLQGENVCGLHVPWNLQVLPADINLAKNNSFCGTPGFSANGTT